MRRFTQGRRVRMARDARGYVCVGGCYARGLRVVAVDGLAHNQLVEHGVQIGHRIDLLDLEV